MTKAEIKEKLLTVIYTSPTMLLRENVSKAIDEICDELDHDMDVMLQAMETASKTLSKIERL